MEEEREQLNIKLFKKTRERLDKFGDKGDTYEDILNKLMNLAEGIKKKIFLKDKRGEICLEEFI